MDDIYSPLPSERGQAATERSDRTLAQQLVGGISIFIMLSGFITLFRTSPMIDPMLMSWTVVVFIWGVLFGIFLLFMVPANRPDANPMARMAIPVILGFAFVGNVSAAREYVVFSGKGSQISQVEAPILGSASCEGRHSLPVIEAQPYPGKVVDIKTTRAICDRFQAPNPADRECVSLQVESGMYGIRRVYAPLSVHPC